MSKWLKFSIPILVILGLVLTSGCAAGVRPPMPAPVPSPPKESVDEGRNTSAVPGELTMERKIIRTGSITLEVEDIAGAMDKVADVADELGGYVVSSHKSEGEKGTSGYITIRVPADRFDEAFDRLRQLAIAVPYKTLRQKM
jgi:hypothetical protein